MAKNATDLEQKVNQEVKFIITLEWWSEKSNSNERWNCCQVKIIIKKRRRKIKCTHQSINQFINGKIRKQISFLRGIWETYFIWKIVIRSMLGKYHNKPKK